MTSRFFNFTLVLILTLVFSLNCYAEKRVALIIGNSEYCSEGYESLTQPANDAVAFNKALNSLGFETILLKNGNLSEMIDSLARFASILDGADVAVFYYSGHGNSIYNVDYIVPSNTQISNYALSSQCLNLNDIVREMKLRSKLSVIFYDACRNNPTAEISFMGLPKGFIDNYKSNELIICYATAQGKKASAGNGSELSPFTEVLLDNIYKEEEFRTLWRYYIQTDKRLCNQIPQLYGSYSGNCYFSKTKMKNEAYNLSYIEAENIALKANSLITNGNSYEASKLLLEYIKQDTTYYPQIERSLRNSFYYTTTILNPNSNCWATSFSPDNKFIVCGSDIGRIYVYETNSGLLVKDFEGHKSFINSVSFNPNNNQIATTSNDKTIKLWNTNNWSLQNTLNSHTGYVYSAVYNKRGDKIISASSDSTIRIWDTLTGKLLQSYKEPIGHVTYAEFSPNNKTFLEVSCDSLIRIGNIKSGKIIKTLKHKMHILSATYSPTNKYIISSSYDGNIKIWDAETYEEIYSFMYDPSSVNNVKFSPCEEFIIASNLVDNNIMLINSKSGKIIQIFDKHTESVLSTSISTDSKLLASSSEDGTIRLWNLQLNNCIKLNNTDSVFDALFMPIEDIVVTRGFRGDESGRGRIELWDRKNGDLIQYYEIEEPNGNIAISSDNKYLAISMDIWNNTPILLYDITKKKLINKISKKDVNALSFSPSSDKLVVSFGPCSPNLEVYDVKNGELLREINISRMHSELITDVCYSPNNKLIITSSIDGNIGLINAEDFSQIAILKGHSKSVLQSIVNQNNTLLYSASSDKSVKIWDLESKVCLKSLTHNNTISSISLSPNEKWLVTGCDDNHIRVYNAINGDLIWDFQFNDNVEKVAFSPDGQHILSIVGYNNIFIWDFPPFESVLEEIKRRFINYNLKIKLDTCE